jgi:hypothetical protein
MMPFPFLILNRFLIISVILHDISKLSNLPLIPDKCRMKLLGQVTHEENEKKIFKMTLRTKRLIMLLFSGGHQAPDKIYVQNALEEKKKMCTDTHEIIRKD